MPSGRDESPPPPPRAGHTIRGEVAPFDVSPPAKMVPEVCVLNIEVWGTQSARGKIAANGLNLH